MIMALLFGASTLVRVELTSPAFAPGARIPAEYTCEGADRPPPLRWGEAPPGTRTWAMIVDDPDAPAGTWLHWTIWNIPELIHELPIEGAVEGTTDFRRIGWNGPCPPKGHGDHRYFFRLYALDAPLAVPSGASRAALEKAMEGHVLGAGELMGTYSRAR